jgi:hypothetical protein
MYSCYAATVLISMLIWPLERKFYLALELQSDRIEAIVCDANLAASISLSNNLTILNGGHGRQYSLYLIISAVLSHAILDCHIESTVVVETALSSGMRVTLSITQRGHAK